MTSSGAFFDPRSISKKSMDGLTDPRINLPGNVGGAQSDIIAQLTREMKLQQGTGSASGLFSGSSDANISSSSSGLGSSSHLNHLITSQIPNSNPGINPVPGVATALNTSSLTSSSTSQQIISQLHQDAAKLNKLGSGVDTSGNLSAAAISAIMTHSAGSSGYKSGGGGLSALSIGDHSSDNSFSDLTGVGKAIQKMPSASMITNPAITNRLPLSSNTSLYLSNNSSITSLNAPGPSGIHTSSLLSASGGTSGLGTSGFNTLTTSILQQQQQLESSIAALSSSNIAGTSSSTPRAILDEKKLVPDKLNLLSRSQPDLFTGIDSSVAGITALTEGT